MVGSEFNWPEVSLSSLPGFWLGISLGISLCLPPVLVLPFKPLSGSKSLDGSETISTGFSFVSFSFEFLLLHYIEAETIKVGNKPKLINIFILFLIFIKALYNNFN
ncbi:hypothetical protein NWE60_00960 [Mycoplasmopsis felis]|nr:hypothetical protein [Mycoplasmopsis felis]WAM01227.1 hypothetical protein NWE60_00960 [Mycoplasmopsis felis]